MSPTGQKLKRRLGFLLRQGREAAGFSQGVVEKRLPAVVTARTLQEWEKGRGNLKPLHYAVWLSRQSATLREGLADLMQDGVDYPLNHPERPGYAFMEADLEAVTPLQLVRARTGRAERDKERAARERSQAQRSQSRWGEIDERSARLAVDERGKKWDDLAEKVREAERRNAKARRESEMKALARRVASEKEPVTTLETLIDPYSWLSETDAEWRERLGVIDNLTELLGGSRRVPATAIARQDEMTTG